MFMTFIRYDILTAKLITSINELQILQPNAFYNFIKLLLVDRHTYRYSFCMNRVFSPLVRTLHSFASSPAIAYESNDSSDTQFPMSSPTKIPCTAPSILRHWQ